MKLDRVAETLRRTTSPAFELSPGPLEAMIGMAVLARPPLADDTLMSKGKLQLKAIAALAASPLRMRSPKSISPPTPKTQLGEMWPTTSTFRVLTPAVSVAPAVPAAMHRAAAQIGGIHRRALSGLVVLMPSSLCRARTDPGRRPGPPLW